MVAVRRTAAARGAGFTLIELLIAIAIIAILAGLLLVGISAARSSGKRFSTINEISQLTLACENFKGDFKAYPPTFPPYTPTLNGTNLTVLNGFTIPKTVNSGDRSYNFLRSMFPHWIPMVVPSGGGSPTLAPDGTAISSTVDANGTSYGGALANEGSTLDGNQALIYFLGGPAGTGWHPTKPYAPAAGAQSVKGPYYDFPSARLKTFPGITLPWFVDTYGTPYCYFAPQSSRATGAANTLLQFPLPTGPTNTSTAPPNSTSPAYPATVTWGWKADGDQNALGTIVVPYYSSANKAESPKGVQIISAGPDQRFGPGDLWTSATLKSQYALQSVGGIGLNPGGDDLANFNGGSLTQE